MPRMLTAAEKAKIKKTIKQKTARISKARNYIENAEALIAKLTLTLRLGRRDGKVISGMLMIYKGGDRYNRSDRVTILANLGIDDIDFWFENSNEDYKPITAEHIKEINKSKFDLLKLEIVTTIVSGDDSSEDSDYETYTKRQFIKYLKDEWGSKR